MSRANIGSLPPARWLQALNRNPVARQERLHLERARLVPRRMRTWVFAAIVALGIVAQGGAAFAAPLGQITGIYTIDIYSFATQISGFCAFAAAAALVIHNLSISMSGARLASGAVAREKQTHTWESLVLTGVSARTIITGKWWAILSTMWSQHRFMLLLRAFIAAWLVTNHSITGRALPSPSIDLVVLVAVLNILIPVFNGVFSTAGGMVVSCLVDHDAAAARLSSVVQFGTYTLVFLFACGASPYVFSGGSTAIALIFAALIFTTLDGGLIATAVVLLGTSESSDLVTYFTGLGLWLVLIAFLTWAALRMARALAVRQGALKQHRPTLL